MRTCAGMSGCVGRCVVSATAIPTLSATRGAADHPLPTEDPHGPLSTTSSRPSATRRSCRLNKLAPPGVNVYVKVESFNPMGSVKDRLALRHHRRRRAQRRAEARPDRHRGHQRQHRHRPGHGVRAEGLSAGGHHGRELQRRAAQAAALSRRPGGADAGGREGQRHAGEGRRAGRTRTAGSCAGSSRTRPTPTCTRAPRRAKSSTTSPIERLDYFVTGFGTGGTLKGVARELKAARPGDRA